MRADVKPRTNAVAPPQQEVNTEDEEEEVNIGDVSQPRNRYVDKCS